MRKTIYRKLRIRGLIENYNRFRKNLSRNLPEKVFIWDETLNEGEQAPIVFLTYVEKVKLAKMLDDIGVSMINIGFPGISEEEEKTISRISNEGFEQVKIVTSARAIISDIDACLRCDTREISIFTPFNELNLQYVLKTTKKDVLEKTVNCVEYAKNHGLTVNFVLEDASRTPLEEISQIFKAAIQTGADRLVIADTVGFLRPLSMHYLITRIKQSLSQLTKKDVQFSVRCHNDFGLATANTLTALEEGVNYPQTSVAGFGELAEKSFVSPIAFHKSIIGENAFSHASEKHIHGMLAHPLIYEPFLPKKIGRETMFYLGKQIGRHLVENRLTLAGIKATPRQVDEIVRRISRQQESLDKGEMLMTFYQIKKLMREMQRGLTEEDFWKIVEQVTKQKPKLMPKLKNQTE